MTGKPKKPESLPAKAPEVITLDLEAIGELDEGQRLPPRPGDPPAPKRAPPPPPSALPTLIGVPAIPPPPVVAPPREEPNEEPPAQVPQLVGMFPVEEPPAVPEPPAPDPAPSAPKHKLARPLNPRVHSDTQAEAASADLAPPPEWLPPPESVIPELNDPPAFAKKEPRGAEPLAVAREKLAGLARVAKDRWRELANGPRARFYVVVGVAAFVTVLLLGILIRLIV